MTGTELFDEIVVWGARGHTQMIITGAEDGWRGRVRIRAVVDDIENGFTHPLLDVPVISGSQRLTDFPEVPVLVSVGSADLRARLHARLVQERATFATMAFRDSGRVSPDLLLAPGAMVAPYTRIGPNVRIGTCAQVLATMVAHDVTVGDFSTVNVGATVLGHVEIGERVNIAPGAMIGNGTRERPLRIGNDAIVGTGAVVLHDVAEGARMVGNPAMSSDDWKSLRAFIASQKLRG